MKKKRGGVIVIAQRGRGEGKTEQKLEPNYSGNTNTLTGVQKDNMILQINDSKESGGQQPYMQNRVYDADGIVPALSQLSDRMNIQVKSATKEGFEVAKEGDSINYTHPNSKTRRGRVGVGVAQTLDTQVNQCTILNSIKNGQEIKRNTSNILQKLREEVGEEKIAEWGFRILDTLQEENVLRPEMYGRSVYEKGEEIKPWMDDSTLSCEKAQEGLLRKMWKQKEFGCSSSKWGLARQFFNEFTNSLQELSYKGTQGEKELSDMPTTLLLKRILHETLSKMVQIWESFDDKSEPIFTTNIRRLTEIETEVLQGFCPNWTKYGMFPTVKISQEKFNKLPNDEKIAYINSDSIKKEISKSQRYKLCGNAVTRDIVELVGKKLLATPTG